VIKRQQDKQLLIMEMSRSESYEEEEYEEPLLRKK
jgi:hypothetical protein